MRTAMSLEEFAALVRHDPGDIRSWAALGLLDPNGASPALRAQCCAGLEFLGIELSDELNEKGAGDRVVSAPNSKVTVLALATNEELIVARRAYRRLSA